MKQFLFMYNGVSDVNLSLGHNIDKFVSCQTVAVQFQVHSLNFWTQKDPEAKFEYTFLMMSLYLVQLAKEYNFLMLSRRIRGPDK